MTAATARRAAPAPTTVALLPLAEVTLAMVSLAAVLGMRRVFPGTDWLGHLGIQVVAAHAITAALRRRGTSLLTSTLVTLVVAGFALTWLYAGETTTLGLPTAATLDVLASSVEASANAFSEVKAPVPTPFLDGFFILTAIAIWVGAIISDWASFRVDAPLEATLPSAMLFVLGAIFGADVDRVLLTGVWIAAVLAFILFRRAERLGKRATWVGERRASGPRAMLVLGGALAASAVVAAALIGPRLPGASSEAVIAPTDVFDDGPGTRYTVSPLVDIRTRLVDQADVEVFTVRSPRSDYWRLTSLDEFDGRIWKSNGSYGEGTGALDAGVPVASDQITVGQQFSIRALSQIWLPAAYEPQSIETSAPVRYDEVSGTLIVDTDVPNSNDITYTVVSALPEHEPAALAAASTEIPSSIADTYLDLPSDFPESVRAVARDVTAGATSPYEKSLRLQNFFRSDAFTYDLDVGPGHGENAMERFVTVDRRGYCEQFAGSFAAMARSLGIPARVAVGFTPGYTDPADPTLYRVRGQNAHAWPEVYLGQYGWVRFEPTPGRGSAIAESYTGVGPEQVAPGGDGTETVQPAAPPTADDSQAPSTTSPDRPLQVPEEIDQGTGGATVDDGPNPWPGRIAWTALAVVLLAVLYLSVIAVVTFARRRRRHRAAVDADTKVALAWEEAIRAVREAGVPVRRAETEQQAAGRIGRRLPSIETPIRSLALTVQNVTYAPRLPDPDVGDQALVLADEIGRTTASTMSGSERFRVRFHPRRLLDS